MNTIRIKAMSLPVNWSPLDHGARARLTILYLTPTIELRYRLCLNRNRLLQPRRVCVLLHRLPAFFT